MSGEFWHRILSLSIHTAHTVWIVALALSVDKSGVIAKYSLFVPPLVIASLLEMWRWALLGRDVVEIKGAYSLASELEATNHKFLLLSWYVIPPIPPRRLLERYSEAGQHFPVTNPRDTFFAKFFLTSEVTKPLLAGAALVLGDLYMNSAPHLWGLGTYKPVVIIVWMAEVGFLAKAISILAFSLLIRIRKGN